MLEDLERFDGEHTARSGVLDLHVQVDAVHGDERLLVIRLAEDERPILDGDLGIADGPGDVALGRTFLFAQGRIQAGQLHVADPAFDPGRRSRAR